MPNKDSNVEEKALAAEVSAEHAAKAVGQAEADDLELRQATKDKASNRLCPHCKAEMLRHGDANPHKAGAWHCNECGCCFRGRELREGHSACALVAAE